MTIDDALVLATQAHKGQKDKNGRPYILHPLRAMVGMGTEVEMLTVLLHDVIEDTEVTREELQREGCPDEVLEALDLLTHDPQVPYAQYIRNIAPHPLARKIKLADLEDNLRVTRLPEVTPKDAERLSKYLKARTYLLTHS